MKKTCLLCVIFSITVLTYFYGCAKFQMQRLPEDSNAKYLVVSGCNFTLYYTGELSSIKGPKGRLRVNEIEIIVENCEVSKNPSNVPVYKMYEYDYHRFLKAPGSKTTYAVPKE